MRRAPHYVTVVSFCELLWVEMSDSRKIEDNHVMLYYTLLTYYYLLTFSISKIGSVLAFSKLTHFNPRQLATPLYSNIVPGL